MHATTFELLMLIFQPLVYTGGAKVPDITFEVMYICVPAVTGASGQTIDVLFAFWVLKPLSWGADTCE